MSYRTQALKLHMGPAPIGVSSPQILAHPYASLQTVVTEAEPPDRVQDPFGPGLVGLISLIQMRCHPRWAMSIKMLAFQVVAPRSSFIFGSAQLLQAVMQMIYL